MSVLKAQSRMRFAARRPWRADRSVLRADLRKPELSVYRKSTVALLQRYATLAVELGRLPSVIGREFFRAQASSYAMHSFEDVAIFVHDMERTVELLSPLDRHLLARIVIQDFTIDEAARLLHTTRRTVTELYPAALDALSELLLARKLLRA